MSHPLLEETERGVCRALWEAGFCGPESAERGSIMMAAKALVREAYETGLGDGLKEAHKDRLVQVTAELEGALGDLMEAHRRVFESSMFPAFRASNSGFVGAWKAAEQALASGGKGDLTKPG